MPFPSYEGIKPLTEEQLAKALRTIAEECTRIQRGNWMLLYDFLGVYYHAEFTTSGDGNPLSLTGGRKYFRPPSEYGYEEVYLLGVWFPISVVIHQTCGNTYVPKIDKEVVVGYSRVDGIHIIHLPPDTLFLPPLYFPDIYEIGVNAIILKRWYADEDFPAYVDAYGHIIALFLVKTPKGYS